MEETVDGLTVTITPGMIDAAIRHAEALEAAGDPESLDQAASLRLHAETWRGRLDSTEAQEEATEAALGGTVNGRLIRRILGATVACLAVVAGVTPHAQARVYPTQRLVRVVVAGPQTRVSAQVLSTAPIGDGSHAVALIGQGGFIVSGQSRVRGPIVPVTVAGTIPSYLLTPGSQIWVASDAGDGSYVGVGVKVLRQSRFAGVRVLPVGAGRGVVIARLQHYDIPTGTYVGSKLSPVAVQYQAGTVWRTAGTVATDAAGNPAAGIVRLPKGVVRVRLVRAEGANVTGAMTGTITIRVN